MPKDNIKKVKVMNQAPIGFVFFAAWIGALVHFVGNADGFWNIILAFLKACVWPAFLVHKIFELLRI